MNPAWLAERMSRIEISGIRKVFELARSLKDPVNLSIGQPHFDVPDHAKAAIIKAIQEGKNGYTVTQGIPELREKIEAHVRKELPHADRQLMITSGTSGGFMLAICCSVNPGDEVIVFDPYFVMYPHVVTLAGGRTTYVDTYPGFGIDVDKVQAAITPRTKAIILNSPANPTGMVVPRGVVRDLAQLAAKRGILLISDEIYRAFCYDEPFTSPAEFNEDVLVLDGFSKSHAMTGWRLGYAHGPRQLIDAMTTLQQFTFVCAPSMVQHAGAMAWGMDLGPYFAEYKRKRDRLAAGLEGHLEFVKPGGAFYFFVRSPRGTGADFFKECVDNNLLLIPGKTFSRQDTHVRISYAAEDSVLDRGIAILRKLAR